MAKKEEIFDQTDRKKVTEFADEFADNQIKMNEAILGSIRLLIERIDALDKRMDKIIEIMKREAD